MVFYIIIGAYLIGVNIAGLVMLFIQKKEKNLTPCERSFSDTNARADSEKAAIKYAEEHSENTGNIGNGDNTKAPMISTVQNENQNKTDSKNESDITIKVNLPKEEETYKEKKQRLKAEKKALKLKQSKDKTKKPVSDFSIILLAVLGGALFIYAGMFFMKYKLKNIPFMLTIPTIIGVNIYVIIKFLGFILVWTAVNPPV